MSVVFQPDSIARLALAHPRRAAFKAQAHRLSLLQGNRATLMWARWAYLRFATLAVMEFVTRSEEKM